tara:strand:+ start:1091 stop:1207 length:117 start_codon:yes stop_codon:yes gene_type:complete
MTDAGSTISVGSLEVQDVRININRRNNNFTKIIISKKL